MSLFKKKPKQKGNKTKAVCVLAVKGGTGKTAIAVQLIIRLAQRMKIAALDADVDSPNLAELLGVTGWIGLDQESRFFIPLQYNENVAVFSTSLYHPDSNFGWTAAGDQNQLLLRNAALHTRWGKRDLFLIDMPAGSSDEFRAIRSFFNNIAGVVVVTQPNTIPDLMRVIDITSRFMLPILGVVENMVEVECCQCKAANILFKDHGKVEELCNQHGIPYTGFIGWVPDLQRTPGPDEDLLPERYRGVIDKLVEVIDAAK